MPEAVVHTDSLVTAPHQVIHRRVQTDPARITTPEADTADTLAVQAAESAIDWSTALPYTVYGTAESLDADLNLGPIVYRQAEAKELFGALSTTAPVTIPPKEGAPSLTANTPFQGLVLLLAAVFALLVSHNLAEVRLLLARISHDSSVGPHLSEGPGSNGFTRFLNIMTTLGILFVGILAVKYADQFITPSQFERLPSSAIFGLSLLVALIFWAIICYQWLALRLSGAVTHTQPLISQLFFLKRTFFSFAIVIASPILLLYALCPRGTGEAWFFVVVIQLAITAILYLWESLNLFISKKISILHWFLYLCAVEIFPLSLLWLLAVR